MMMIWQELMALKHFDFFDTLFLIKLAVTTVLVYIMIYLENDELRYDEIRMGRFPFFIMTLIYAIIIFTVKDTYSQQLGKAEFGILLETGMVSLLCMIYAWMAVKRIRDTRYSKSFAYLLCIPVVNIFLIIHLFFAKPKN